MSQIGIKHNQLPAKTTNTVQQTKETPGVSVSESCKLLSFFISWAILRVLLLAGTSSEGGCYLSGRPFWMISFAIAHFEFFFEFLSSVAGRYKRKEWPSEFMAGLN